MRRILTIGTDSASCRAAIAAAEAHEEVFAAVGRHPNDSTGYDDAVTDELRELARHPRVRAIGETGLDDYRDYAPRADQERAFCAHMELARETGKPLVIHTRAAEDDTIAMLDREAQGLEVILHCFSMPDRLDECLERGWWISFAGNVTYPKAQDLADAAERAPLDRLLVETDAPVPDAAGAAQGAQPARLRRPHRALRRRAPRDRLRGARGGRRGQRRPAVRLVSELPAQPSLRRMKAFGIRPNRDLGQNFLIDSNLLEVISRAAELGPDDVVLEVGGGLGVLSEHLAERARHVHVVELDRRLEPPLRDALDPHANVTLHLADAVKLDLAALDPAPTKVVANLPYGVAATVILRTIERLPEVTTWVAMVQHEVGERFAAAPGLDRLRRPVRARPARVRREGDPPRLAERVLPGAQRRLRAGAPAPHRRGGRAPELAARAGPAGLRAPAQGARALGLAAGRRPRRRPRRARGDRHARRRARRDARPGGVARAVREARVRLRCLAPGKVNLCLFVGAPREDGLHPLVSVVQAVSLADELTLEPARRASADEVVCPGVEGENLAGAALAAFREATGWDGPPQRLTIDKRVPVAAGMGGGSGDAAAALRLAAHAAGGADAALLLALAAGLGGDVPSLVAPGRTLMTGAGEHVRALEPPASRSRS